MGNIFEGFDMDNRYNRHNRRKYYLWQKYPNFLSKQYWKKKIFWSDVTLLVVQAKYRWLPYKTTFRAKVNGYEFTRLLPPAKASGFPPTTTERILFMKESPGRVEIHELYWYTKVATSCSNNI